MTTEEHPPRVLVIAAHPDDADISSGGAVARWAREEIIPCVRITLPVVGFDRRAVFEALESAQE